MPRRLLIVDHYDSPALKTAAAEAQQDEPCDILLLGGSPEWFAWRYPDLQARLAGCRLLSAAPWAAEAHAIVNDFVVRTAAQLPFLEFGGTTLARLLRRQGVNGWWFLQTAEKGPYRTPLVGQLYRLALAHLAVRDRTAVNGTTDVRFSIREPAVAAALASAVTPENGWRFAEAVPAPPVPRLEGRPLARLALIVLRTLGRSMSARLLSLALPRVETTPGGTGRWAFTVFPSWWTRVPSGDPGDRFLTHLREARFEGYFGWLAETQFLWRHLRAVRRAAGAIRLVALQQFLGVREGLAILSPARFRRLAVFERQIRPALRLAFLGFEVGPLFGDDISRSMSSQEPIQDELLERALRRAADRHRPRLMLYRAEFQPIETALLSGLAGRATRVGFHHHPFRHYPQMYFTPEQIGAWTREEAAGDGRPFPDGVVAIGSALAANLAEGGYPSERITVCGPQRYGPLAAYRAQQAPPAALRERLGLEPAGFLVFVALAIVEADTEALFGSLVEACRDMPHVQLVIKTHPNRPKGDPALHATLDALGRERASLMPDSGNMYDYIGAADCMVCIGSMIAFEAMALGVMPVVFDNPATYGSVSLAAYEEGLFNVRDADELRAALGNIRANTSVAQAKRRVWPGLLARVLGDMDRPLAAQMDAALARLAPPAAAGARS